MVISQFPAAFGKYILLDRVNAGGMAEVFRAKVTGAESFQRLVAIKCMLPALLSDEHFITMFIDEAKLAAQLNHANIVQIYELGRLGERLFIAMELIQGRDLRHVLRTAHAAGTPLPRGFAAYVVSKVAAGLDYAHRKVGVDGRPLQLVHRDVSPQNILVSFDGEVKVVDFGIARAEARTTETQAGILKGKFAYMAPEQVIGAASDHRADIFALGSVLFEAVTGQRLFTGENDLAVLEHVRDVVLPDLRSVLPPGAEALDPVLRRALAKKPADRYAFASEMADALEQLLFEDRSLFGYKRAAEFMQALYQDEVAKSAEQLRAYTAVRREDCVVAYGEAPAERDHTFVIEGLTPGKPPEAGSAVPSRRPGNTRVVTLSDVASVAAEPRTGAHTRAVPRPPVPGDTERHGGLPVDGATAVDGAALGPQDTAGGRVMRRLQAGTMVATLVAAVLVIGLFVSQAMRTRERAAQGALALAQKQAPQVFESNPAPDGPTPTGADADDDEVDALGRPRFGWVQVKSTSPARARVFIDGHDAGLLPVAPRRVRVGEHLIKVVEEGSGRVRQAPAAVSITPRHTRRAPKLVAL